MDVQHTSARPSRKESDREARLLVAVSSRTLWLVAGIALLFIGVGATVNGRSSIAVIEPKRFTRRSTRIGSLLVLAIVADLIAALLAPLSRSFGSVLAFDSPPQAPR